MVNDAADAAKVANFLNGLIGPPLINAAFGSTGGTMDFNDIAAGMVMGHLGEDSWLTLAAGVRGSRWKSEFFEWWASARQVLGTAS